jgi:hypothetical protein
MRETNMWMTSTVMIPLSNGDAVDSRANPETEGRDSTVVTHPSGRMPIRRDRPEVLEELLAEKTQTRHKKRRQ